MSAITKLMTPGGGGVALTPASSIASDVTVSVPAQNCTLDIQGPAFSVYTSVSQTISSSTDTKIQLNTENFDTANCFDSTTNYRFTPNVAGYYQVSWAVGMQHTYSSSFLYKNGSRYKIGAVGTTDGNYAFSAGSSLVYMNGSTDYLEIYVFQNSGTTKTTLQGDIYTWFNGNLVRAA